MKPEQIRVGACYAAGPIDGIMRVRKVIAIRTFEDGSRYVDAVSRHMDDPPDKWPGQNGAYIDVFAANSLFEVTTDTAATEDA